MGADGPAVPPPGRVNAERIADSIAAYTKAGNPAAREWLISTIEYAIDDAVRTRCDKVDEARRRSWLYVSGVCIVVGTLFMFPCENYNGLGTVFMTLGNLFVMASLVGTGKKARHV